jgi:hypothetical protein
MAICAGICVDHHSIIAVRFSPSLIIDCHQFPALAYELCDAKLRATVAGTRIRFLHLNKSRAVN